MAQGHFQGSERRRFKRIEKPYTVSLRTHRTGTSRDWDMVLIRDISAGGVLFRYHEGFDEGRLLDFRVQFALNTPPLDCVGKVIRYKASGRPAVYDIAVEFTRIAPEYCRLIEESAAKFHATKRAV